MQIAYFPVHGGKEGNCNIQVTGHTVAVGSQGLGNGCRRKDTVHLRSVHNPVTAWVGLTTDRKTEDVMDVNHLGCAGLIRAVEVDISFKKKNLKKKREKKSASLVAVV